MSDTIITYHGKQITVPQEVAEYLEQDRKRAQAQKKRDDRHLDNRDYETLLNHHVREHRETEDKALLNLRRESLRKACDELDEEDRRMLSLRYQGELTLEEIGKIFGVSKMAISKKLKKIHEKLRGSVD